MPPGRFITLEGGEGAGKSTQAKLLEAALTASGHRVLRTREPGGAPGAEAIRRLLLNLDGAGIAAWDRVAECMLHFAARREHVVRTIRPALAEGVWVISDRFADSTMAYQVHGQGVPRPVFDSLAALALDGLRPDLTFILDLPPEQGLARAAARGDGNRYEAMDLEFHRRVHAGFRAIAAAEPARCVLVDAAAAPEAVAAALWRHLQDRLPA